MRLVRWWGDPSPFDDANIRRAIARGAVPMALLAAFRVFENHQRIVPTRGADVAFGPDHGYSRSYRFTAEAPFQWMEPADAARLLGNPWERWQFADVTDAPSAERPPMTKDRWRALVADFAKLDGQRRLKRQYR